MTFEYLAQNGHAEGAFVDGLSSFGGIALCALGSLPLLSYNAK
jgi:hypothetical protein